MKDKIVTFDGTTRLGEVLAVIFRYIDGWEIKQRLVRLEILSKSMKCEEITRELINILSMDYSMRSNRLVASQPRLSGRKAWYPLFAHARNFTRILRIPYTSVILRDA